MRIRKFTAKTVKEALGSVKAALGPDALIIGTKRLGDGGGYEVAAAVDYGLDGPVPEARAMETSRREAPAGGAFAHDARYVQLLDEIDELKEVKELFNSVITRADTPMAKLYERLNSELGKNGIDARLARKILTNAFKGIKAGASANAETLKAQMKRKLFEKVRVTDPLDGKSVVAFVGPTGVGKTTTIAKLAAINALKKKRSVALLTMDTFRIAAAEQLKTYGKIIGVPVEAAQDSRELGARLAAHRDKDLVLIDTAGRSQRDERHMEELSSLARSNPEIKFNLVLSSQMRDDALYESVRGFKAAPIDSLTFTKLDEGSVYGPILNTTLLSRSPVAYLAAGQNVPEDIEAASRERLVDFFMPN